MRVTPISSRDDVPAAIQNAGTDPESRWYVARVAKALGVADLIPESWSQAAGAGTDSPVDHAVSIEEEELDAAAKQFADAIEAALRDYAADDETVEDTSAVVASLVTRADIDNVGDQVLAYVTKRTEAMVAAGMLDQGEAQVLIAAAAKPRRVRSAAGAKRFGQSIGQVITTDPTELANNPLARLPRKGDVIKVSTTKTGHVNAVRVKSVNVKKQATATTPTQYSYNIEDPSDPGGSSFAGIDMKSVKGAWDQKKFDSSAEGKAYKIYEDLRLDQANNGGSMAPVDTAQRSYENIRLQNKVGSGPDNTVADLDRLIKENQAELKGTQVSNSNPDYVYLKRNARDLKLRRDNMVNSQKPTPATIKAPATDAKPGVIPPPANTKNKDIAELKAGDIYVEPETGNKFEVISYSFSGDADRRKASARPTHTLEIKNLQTGKQWSHSATEDELVFEKQSFYVLDSQKATPATTKSPSTDQTPTSSSASMIKSATDKELDYYIKQFEPIAKSGNADAQAALDLAKQTKRDRLIAKIGGKGQKTPNWNIGVGPTSKSASPAPTVQNHADMSDQDKINAAEKMYGTGSAMHKAAQKKFGIPSTPAPAAPSAGSFTSGKDVKYGVINPKLKKGDPGHDTPQVSFGDGTKPVVGNKIIAADGRTGTVVETYQGFTKVQWDTGRAKVMKNGDLNSAGKA